VNPMSLTRLVDHVSLVFKATCSTGPMSKVNRGGGGQGGKGLGGAGEKKKFPAPQQQPEEKIEMVKQKDPYSPAQTFNRRFPRGTGEVTREGQPLTQAAAAQPPKGRYKLGGVSPLWVPCGRRGRLLQPKRRENRDVDPKGTGKWSACVRLMYGGRTTFTIPQKRCERSIRSTLASERLRGPAQGVLPGLWGARKLDGFLANQPRLPHRKCQIRP